jgi:SAM-dependent methyltransferase
MTPMGSHLAYDARLGPAERAYVRAFGTPDPSLRVRTSHVLRALRKLEPGVVLDAGCGAGFTVIAAALRMPGVRMIGIDADARQVEHAIDLAARAGATSASFERTDVFEYEPDSPVDVVLCVDALEYFEDDASFLSRVRSWLVPGGALVLHCRRVPTPRYLPSFRRADPLLDGRRRSGYEAGALTDLLEGARFGSVRLRQTLTPPAELAHELADPELGVVRGRLLRALTGPLLAVVASLDVVPMGPGAGLLAVAIAR